MRLLSEVGIPNGNCDTYEVTSRDKLSIIDNNVSLCIRYGLKVSEKEKCLPIMYWMPKMHKNPTDARFIIASSTCSTKPLSSVISNVFKLIFRQIQNFHDKSTFYSRYKKFWVVQNSSPVLDKLHKINLKSNAHCISTFDFKTLYTKIEHNNLVKVLNDIIDLAFKGGKRKIIAFDDYKAFWAIKRRKKSFTKEKLKAVVKHLVQECHFEVGNCTLSQIIGIPMGIDPAPFWANLYLYAYECEFMTKLTKQDKKRAFKYHGLSRFIDDMCCINDSGEFEKSYRDIYPPSLELKIEHRGQHATFLDLDITIENNIFIYKLFDKRDDFPFFIVRMPNLSSDIPSYVFYGSLMSEFLRIARCTLRISDFCSRSASLVRRMKNQGANTLAIKRQLEKGIARHPNVFTKYRKTAAEIYECINTQLG